MSKSPQPDDGLHTTRDAPPVIYLDGAGGRVMPGVGPTASTR